MNSIYGSDIYECTNLLYNIIMDFIPSLKITGKTS